MVVRDHWGPLGHEILRIYFKQMILRVGLRMFDCYSKRIFRRYYCMLRKAEYQARKVGQQPNYHKYNIFIGMIR